MVAPASMARSTTSTRKSSSVRAESSAENSTSSNRSRAIFTPSTARRMISSLAILSLKSRWMGLVARKTWQRRWGASLSASQEAAMSPLLQRERLAMMGPSTWRLTPWMASRSPGEAAAKPASITSTPRSRSARATWSFCSRFIDAPGDCSPSRSVVSKMMMRSAPAWLTLCSPLVTAAGCGCWLPGCFGMGGPRAPGVGPKRVARLSRATSSAGWAEEVAAQRHPGRDTSPAGLRSRRMLHAGVIEPAKIVPGAPGGQGWQPPPPHKAV